MATTDESGRAQPGSWRIARVLGVDIYLHWSLFFLLLYVIFLSTARYSAIVMQSGLNAGRASWVPWLFGLVFAAGLFVSVVAHELGHVWVAQSQGVRAKGITLMMLGGVSEMGQVPEKPYAELKLAIIGPIVSLVVSGLMWAVHLGLLSVLPKLSLLAYWLAETNLVLAIFNLVPALPLDGGRVLRSFLAVKQGNLRATQNAVKVSQVLAWTLGLLGFFQLNFFLLLIAFFVYSASQTELVLMMTKIVLKGVLVGEAMVRVAPISETMSLHDGALEMLRTKKPILPVQSVSNAPFILSIDAIRRVDRTQWPTTPVSDVMESPSALLDVNDPIGQALSVMASGSQMALPVLDHGALVGILTYSDLVELTQLKSLEEFPFGYQQEREKLEAQEPAEVTSTKAVSKAGASKGGKESHTPEREKEKAA